MATTTNEACIYLPHGETCCEHWPAAGSHNPGPRLAESILILPSVPNATEMWWSGWLASAQLVGKRCAADDRQKEDRQTSHMILESFGGALQTIRSSTVVEFIYAKGVITPVGSYVRSAKPLLEMS